MNTILKTSSVLVTAFLFACNSPQNGSTQSQKSTPDPLVTNRDTSINPANDFFDYANGGWIKANPIPPDYSSFGIARLVQNDLQERLKLLNETAVKSPKDDISRKIAAFWKSGMDSINTEKQGAVALRQILNNIDAIDNKEKLMEQMAMLQKIGVSTMLDIGIYQDEMNSQEMSLHLHQGGLGMPDRDYYFNTDAQTATVRNAYPNYISTLLKALGEEENTAKKNAQAILKLETTLAQNSRTLEALRDPYKNYNKMASAAIKNKLTADIDWVKLLPILGIEKADSVVIGQPEFLKALNQQLNATTLPVWKSYLKFHTISTFAPYLSSVFEKAHFDFYDKTLTGVQQQEPRWKRVLNAEENAMGEALGQLFVKEYFSEKTKKRYSDMVEAIRGALKERIDKLDWMSPDTKAKAQDKLAKMKKKVGYPDKWKDFSAMNISEQPYVMNIIAANQWWYKYQVAKLNKPVNRDEWEMTPQTYNAYYNPSNNEIVLPAGIFTVPGKRDEELDDALVYGYAAASTIGHEITHGFDDQGRQFDADGNLNNWWTKEDEAQFNKRADVMVRQFDHFEPLPGKHINGKATLGENIADLGGVLLGWDAFIKTEAYKNNKAINGQSPAQRYFLGYALGWLYNMREASLAQRLMTDVHSPAKYRVNGPFANVDAFYKTFNVQAGNGMFVPDSSRVKIW